MPPRNIAVGGLIPVGFQVMSLANSTAIAINSTCRAADVLDISVETNHARYRIDGTTPALTTGVLLPKDTWYRFEGFNRTSQLKFQRSTGTSKVSIIAYRHR